MLDLVEFFRLSEVSSERITLYLVAEEKARHAVKKALAVFNLSNRKGPVFDAIILTQRQYYKMADSITDKKDRVVFFGESKYLFSLQSWEIKDWYFNNFGFKYGRVSSNALIIFDKDPLSSDVYLLDGALRKKLEDHGIDIEPEDIALGNWWTDLSTTKKTLIGVGVVAVIAVTAGVAIHFINNSENKEGSSSDSVEIDIDDDLPDVSIEDDEDSTEYGDVNVEYGALYEETKTRIFDEMADDGSQGDEDDAAAQAFDEILSNNPDLTEESLWKSIYMFDDKDMEGCSFEVDDDHTDDDDLMNDYFDEVWGWNDSDDIVIIDDDDD